MGAPGARPVSGFGQHLGERVRLARAEEPELDAHFVVLYPANDPWESALALRALELDVDRDVGAERSGTRGSNVHAAEAEVPAHPRLPRTFGNAELHGVAG